MLTLEQISTMSLSELKLYLKTLKKEVFPVDPKGNNYTKNRIVKDIYLLQTVNEGAGAMEAVKVARRNMKRPVALETTVIDETTNIVAPAIPVTYHSESALKRGRKKKVSVVTPTEAPAEVSQSAPLPEPAPRPRAQVATGLDPPTPPVPEVISSKYARYMKPL